MIIIEILNNFPTRTKYELHTYISELKSYKTEYSFTKLPILYNILSALSFNLNLQRDFFLIKYGSINYDSKNS